MNVCVCFAGVLNYKVMRRGETGEVRRSAEEQRTECH